MLILSGYSEKRSSYYINSSYLQLSGWVLSPLTDAIIIYSIGIYVGTAKIDIEHTNIWLSYNKIGDKICGWYFEDHVDAIDYDNLVYTILTKTSFFLHKILQLISMKKRKLISIILKL